MPRPILRRQTKANGYDRGEEQRAISALEQSRLAGITLRPHPGPLPRSERENLGAITPSPLSRLRFCHGPGVEGFIEIGFGENLLFHAEFADCLAGFEGFLGERGGSFVADQRIEARDH